MFYYKLILQNVYFVIFFDLYVFIFSSLLFKEEKTKQKRRNVAVLNALTSIG